MQDTETQEETHVRIASHFLDAADKLFDEAGDYVQTSEKLWGATMGYGVTPGKRSVSVGTGGTASTPTSGRLRNGWPKKPETRPS